MLRSRWFALLLPFALALVATPASAETMAAADFQPGQTFGLGFAGVSYDYAWSRFSLGGALAAANFTAIDQHMLLSTRGVLRFLDSPDFLAAAIVGLELDPGYVGGRSYLVPDIGVGVAYHTVYGGTPIAVRLNFTVTVSQDQTGPIAVPAGTGPSFNQGTIDLPTSQPNILQRLAFGPNTNLGAGITLGDHLEVTVGGGTVVGVRYHY